MDPFLLGDWLCVCPYWVFDLLCYMAQFLRYMTLPEHTMIRRALSLYEDTTWEHWLLLHDLCGEYQIDTLHLLEDRIELLRDGTRCHIVWVTKK